MKLFVAGCSVSDYTHVEKVYGDYLAEKIGYEYIHEGAGGGSNFRMWRRITNHILNGNLTSNDLLIVQYTDLTRHEFWSNHQGQEIAGGGNGLQKLRERYNDGDIIRFKMQSYTWQETNEEINFFRLYENNFITESFEKEVFETQHLMFQCLLKEYSIKTIFWSHYLHKEDIKLIPYFKNSYFFEDIKNNENYHLNNDLNHLNNAGHMYIADKLFSFIRQ